MRAPAYLPKLGAAWGIGLVFPTAVGALGRCVRAWVAWLSGAALHVTGMVLGFMGTGTH